MWHLVNRHIYTIYRIYFKTKIVHCAQDTWARSLSKELMNTYLTDEVIIQNYRNPPKAPESSSAGYEEEWLDPQPTRRGASTNFWNL